MDKDEGGYVFPVPITQADYGTIVSKYMGMTLRDYLLAYAPEIPKWYIAVKSGADYTNVKEGELYFSWRSYYADMMIKERNK